MTGTHALFTPLSAVGLAEAWIYQTLRADAALDALVAGRIFAGLAPEGTPYPLVTYQGVVGQDLTTPGYHRVFTTFEYDIHCADRVGSIVGLDQIASRIDTLLHGQGSYQFPSGAYTVSCRRMRIVPLANQIAGVAIREIVLSIELIMQEAQDV